MTLADWRTRIADPVQCGVNLHAFNDSRDTGNSSLNAVRSEFDQYLIGLDSVQRRLSPTRQLKDFCSQDSIRIGGYGQALRADRRVSRLTSLSKKGYRTLEMAALRIDQSVIELINDEIASGIKAAASRPSSRKSLQSAVSKKLVKSVSRTVVAPPIVGGLKIGATRGSAVAKKDDLAWITCQEALANEMGENPEDVKPAFASLYAAAYHGAMGLPMTRFYGSLSGADRGLLLYEMDVAVGDLSSVKQPNMFSGGNPKMFVTREPIKPGGDDMPGRTVRLVDTRCCKDSMQALYHCKSGKCGAEGLPEAVTSFATISRATIEFKGVFVLYPSEARHYQIPSCDLIRARN